jgi:hypothetical protein
MITQRRIKTAVCDAEQTFENCWSKLLDIQKGKLESVELAKTIYSFQSVLLIALYKLQKTYKEICEDERNVVDRKPSRFRVRLQIFNRYKQIIIETIDVGKVIGDSFAWFFYQGHRQFLRNHHEHEPITEIPTGVGGRGEIAFIQRPKIADYFALIHSTTSFLRHLDFSLFDPKEWKVFALGELKTREDKDKNFVLSMSLIGENLGQRKFPTRPAVEPPQDLSSQQLSPKAQTRFERQMKAASDSFRPTDIDGNLGKIKLQTTPVYEKLKEVFDKSASQTWEGVKADRGFAIVGARLHGSSLFTRLTTGVPEFNKSLPEFAVVIQDKKLSDNSIRISRLLYHSESRYKLLVGMRPVFWWPISEELREALVFKKFVAVTFYNSAFLIEDLRKAGIEVSVASNHVVQVRKTTAKIKSEISDIGYFIDMVQDYLFSDSLVVDILTNYFDAVEKADLNKSIKVQWDFDFAV